MDCVHEINRHMDGAEADAEEEEDDYYNVTNDTFQHGNDTERKSDSDMEGDDSDGRDTERRTRPKILNNFNGVVELSHLETNYYKKRPIQSSGPF
jgi:hypothetical protein